MKSAAFAIATVSLIMISAPAIAAAPKFTGSCPTGITVKSNGSGTIRINGKKASVKTLNSNAWEARANGVTIDIARDAGGLILSYTAKGGANGICQVTSAAASAGSAPSSGTPSKDEQACLAATSRQTNNGDVTVLSTETSEANNTVYVGVGPQRAKWKCLVKNGKVAEVQSMTDEGGL
jgi:hypothetical protein